MSYHFVFGWELGAGYGHVAGMAPLIRELRERGHRVSLIARNLHAAQVVLGEHCDAIYQAPIWLSHAQGAKLDVTYTHAEILLGQGFRHSGQLSPLVRGWLLLLEGLAPDMVLLDYSPTGVLACRVGNYRFATLGMGFYIPPPAKPAPPFAGVGDPPGDRIETHEALVLDAVNGVLREHGLDTLDSFSQLYHPGQHFLCTLSELDHYEAREDVTYLGPRFNETMGEKVAWPAVPGPRIFAYIKETSKDFDNLFQAIVDAGASVVMHVPSPSKALLERAAGLPGVLLSPEPVLASQMKEEAELVVCHAGHGLVSAMLLAGRRLLLVPDHLEQNIFAFRLTQQRLAMALQPGTGVERYAAALRAALLSAELGSNLAAFRSKYSEFSQQTQVDLLAEQCEERIARG